MSSSPTTGRHARARQQRLVVVVLTVVIILVALVSLSAGSSGVGPVEVLRAWSGDMDRETRFVIWTLRMPRVVTGVLVGAAFGLSGGILQRLARNPLASPDIVGVSAGAGTVAVALIVLGGAGALVVALGALAGGLATAALVTLLASGLGSSSYRLVVIGIGVGGVLASITSWLLASADLYSAERATVWLIGSLNGRTWEHAAMAGIAVLVGAPVAMALGRSLRVLRLGDDVATALGVRTAWVRLGLIVTSVGLAAMATAAAGPIVFVAFMAHPIAQRLTHATDSLVSDALMGALLVVGADLVGRRAMAPAELPVGIVTGIIGAPYLLWLLARARTGATG